MELRQLRTFEAVIEHGTVTDAANALGLAPSSVSEQIRTLERSLGVELFDRGPKGMRLTAAGERMRGWAGRLLGQAEQARREVAGEPPVVRLGAPLLQLDGIEDLEVEAAIPESLAPGVAVGAELALSVDEGAPGLRGMVRELASASDSASRTVTARVALPAGAAVHAGQFARVWLPGSATPVLLVPRAAVSALGQMERVFVATPERRAALRLVRTGAGRGEFIEIAAGLEPGERVILDAPPALRFAHSRFTGADPPGAGETSCDHPGHRVSEMCRWYSRSDKMRASIQIHRPAELLLPCQVSAQ